MQAGVESFESKRDGNRAGSTASSNASFNAPQNWEIDDAMDHRLANLNGYVC